MITADEIVEAYRHTGLKLLRAGLVVDLSNGDHEDRLASGLAAIGIYKNTTTFEECLSKTKVNGNIVSSDMGWDCNLGLDKDFIFGFNDGWNYPHPQSKDYKYMSGFVLGTKAF